MRFLICLLTVAMLIPATVAAANPPADLEARRKALNDLASTSVGNIRCAPARSTLRSWVTSATTTSWTTFRSKRSMTIWNRPAASSTASRRSTRLAFPEQEALNKQLMVRDLKMALEGARFKPWEMPVNQSSGIHIDAPQLVSVLSYDNVKDLRRLHYAAQATSSFVRPDHRADAQRSGRGIDSAKDSAGKGSDPSERNCHHSPGSKPVRSSFR